jgi:DNA-binding transcriptional LysR family regulator
MQWFEPSLDKMGPIQVQHPRRLDIGMFDGLEAEVALVVDVMLPTERLVDAMQAFEREFPTVALRLHVEALGAVTQLVLSGTANIGISGPEHARIGEQIRVGGVDRIPVAAPSHPRAVESGECARSRSKPCSTSFSPTVRPVTPWIVAICCAEPKVALPLVST